MSQLFDAFRRVADKSQGTVFIDGHEAYRHWMEPENTINWETKGSGEDVAFVDQEVHFDSHGLAQASDVHGKSRELRVLVLVPFGPRLQVLELISPPDRGLD